MWWGAGGAYAQVHSHYTFKHRHTHSLVQSQTHVHTHAWHTFVHSLTMGGTYTHAHRLHIRTHIHSLTHLLTYRGGRDGGAWGAGMAEGGLGRLHECLDYVGVHLPGLRGPPVVGLCWGSVSLCLFGWESACVGVRVWLCLGLQVKLSSSHFF